MPLSRHNNNSKNKSNSVFFPTSRAAPPRETHRGVNGHLVVGRGHRSWATGGEFVSAPSSSSTRPNGHVHHAPNGVVHPHHHDHLGFEWKNGGVVDESSEEGRRRRRRRAAASLFIAPSPTTTPTNVVSPLGGAIYSPTSATTAPTFVTPSNVMMFNNASAFDVEVGTVSGPAKRPRPLYQKRRSHPPQQHSLHSTHTNPLVANAAFALPMGNTTWQRHGQRQLDYLRDSGGESWDARRSYPQAFWGNTNMMMGMEFQPKGTPIPTASNLLRRTTATTTRPNGTAVVSPSLESSSDIWRRSLFNANGQPPTMYLPQLTDVVAPPDSLLNPFASYVPSYLTHPPTAMLPNNGTRAMLPYIAEKVAKMRRELGYCCDDDDFGGIAHGCEEMEARYPLLARLVLKFAQLLLSVAVIVLVLAPMRGNNYETFVIRTRTEWQGLVLGIAGVLSMCTLLLLATLFLANRWESWRQVDGVVSVLAALLYLLAAPVEAYYAACYPPLGWQLRLACYRAEWIAAAVLCCLNLVAYTTDALMALRSGVNLL